MKKTTMVAVLLCGCAQAPADIDQQARRFAEAVGMKVAGVSCTGWDTNQDGYVTCTVGIESAEGIRPVSVECASVLSLAQGCRMQKLVVQQ